MKAIKMRMQKFSRPGVILIATVVVIITSIVVANATQTITTPNAVFISYNLGPGASSAAITPAASKSVLIMGCTNSGSIGVGQVTLLHIPGGSMSWLGLEPMGAGNGSITIGNSSTKGTHIVSIDFGGNTDIQVASADTILIRNFGLLGNIAGNVTLIW
jgi:hypothetical protein